MTTRRHWRLALLVLAHVAGASIGRAAPDLVWVEEAPNTPTPADLTLIAPAGSQRVLWIDGAGEVVRELDLPGQWSYVEQLPTGNLLTLSADRVAEFDRLGRLEWEYRPDSGWLHHDAVRVPSGSTFTLLSIKHPELGILSDVVVEVDPSGNEIWRWDALEHLDPVADPGPHSHIHGGFRDWLHTNSIGFFADGDLLLSLRNLNRLVRVDYPSGRIVWSWGDGILGHQHSAKVLPNGNILLFDNGIFRGAKQCEKRCASRALEIDPQSGEIVWRFEPRGLFSAGFGDADRLANGNTLVTFGQQPGGALVVEVTPEGAVVWMLRSNLKGKVFSLGPTPRATLYRSQRVPRGLAPNAMSFGFPAVLVLGLAVCAVVGCALSRVLADCDRSRIRT